MKYLVTGGCGFIGSNYILQLLERDSNVQVVNVDCLTYAGRPENLASVEQDSRYKFYLADIRHPVVMDKIFELERPDIVIAFAAESHVDRSIESADVFIHTNIVGTFNLLEAARKVGVGTFVQIGSVTSDTPVCVRNIKTQDISIVGIGSLCNDTIQDYETLVLNPDHEVVFAPVKYHISHKANLLYHIKYTGGEVTATGNHSVFIFDEYGNIVQRRADELKEGDKLVTFVGDIDSGARNNVLDLRKVMQSYDTQQTRQFLSLANEALKGLNGKRHIWNLYSTSILQRLIKLQYIRKEQEQWLLTEKANEDLKNGLSNLRWEWIKTKLRIPNDEIVITPNIARALGLYVAEGHREHTKRGVEKNTNRITWTLSINENDKIAWLNEIANTFGGTTKIHTRVQDHCLQISIANRALHSFLEQFGSTADTKRVPPFIWALPSHLIRCFLEGYEGDAHIKNTKTRKYTSVNKQLLIELAWLCRLNNIDSNLCFYKYKNNCLPYCPRPFDGIYGQLAIASCNYKEQTGLRKPWARCLPKEYVAQKINKNSRMYDYTQSLSRTAIANIDDTTPIPSSIGFAKVKSVRSIQKDTTVYDLSIPENHTFFGGTVPILLHNTDEVYGQIPMPRSSVETDSLDPRSPYSSSKASGDLLALSYYTTHKLPVIVTRCCNNLGPFQFPEKLIPLFITNLMDGKQVPVYGDGRQIREWIHVDDHNRAVDFVIQNGQPGQIYNIGSGVEMENIDITKLLLKLLNRDESLIRYVEDRKGHDRRYSIDCSKLKGLGWQSIHTFETGIQETIEWYKNNEDWWRPIKK